MYCGKLAKSEKTTERILGAILMQLYMAETTVIPDTVKKTYGRKVNQQRKFGPGLDELERWLSEVGAAPHRVGNCPVVVLDGVDELEAAVRADVLQALQSTLLPSSKLLVTSRFVPEIFDTDTTSNICRLIIIESKDQDLKHFVLETLKKPASRKLKSLIGGKSRQG